jgi:hypothetical protein
MGGTPDRKKVCNQLAQQTIFEFTGHLRTRSVVGDQDVDRCHQPLAPLRRTAWIRARRPRGCSNRPNRRLMLRDSFLPVWDVFVAAGSWRLLAYRNLTYDSRRLVGQYRLWVNKAKSMVRTRCSGCKLVAGRPPASRHEVSKRETGTAN